MGRFAETINLLIEGLPYGEQTEYRQRFEQVRRGAPPQRGGEVFGNVIALFKRDQRLEWTVPGIQAALAQNGTSPDPKSLYNTITYLVNTGRLQRVSRGQYVVTGYGVTVHTDEEIAGADHGTSRISEHDV
jgi:hypothetical protein